MFLQLQRDLILFLQEFHNSFTELFFQFVSFLGDPEFYFLVIGFFFWVQNKRAAELIGVTLGVSVTINNILKGVFMIERPFLAHGEVADYHRRTPMSSSFPSGHAQSSSTVFYGIARCFRRRYLWLLAGVVMVFMWLSRMFLGMHYLQDVIAGSAIGIGVALGGHALFTRLESRPRNLVLLYLIVLLALLPGAFMDDVADFFRRYGILVGLVISFLIDRYHTQLPLAGLSFKNKLFRLALGAGLVLAGMELFHWLQGLWAWTDTNLGGDLFEFFGKLAITLLAFTLYPLALKRLHL